MTYDSVAGLFIAIAGFLLIAGSAPALRYAQRSATVTPQVSYQMLTWLARIMGVILLILGIVTWRMLTY